MKEKDMFYVHEAYARKMANNRFIAGMFLGGLIVWTMPIYKAVRTGIKKALDEKTQRKMEEVDEHSES